MLYETCALQQGYAVQTRVQGPYADHVLIPLGSTGSSVFFGFK